MPGFDGTGPEGKGPGTGRGLGKCNGASQGSRSFRGCRRHRRWRVARAEPEEKEAEQ